MYVYNFISTIIKLKIQLSITTIIYASVLDVEEKALAF